MTIGHTSDRICPGCRPPSAFAALAAVRPGPTTPPTGSDHREPVGSPTGPAEVVVIGRVVTMDPDRPVAEAVAIRGGRILALGAVEDLEAHIGPDTEVLELGDDVCYPGFVEPHMHLWATALFDGFVDCSALTNDSHRAVFTGLAEAASATPDGSWVCGHLWDPALFPEAPALGREVLDALIPDHPAFVVNASMHFAYLNSAGLEAIGLTDDVADPPGGTFGRRDGRLDGVLGELPAMLPAIAALPRRSHDQFLDAVERVAHVAATAGVTKVHEAGTGALFGAGELEMLHELAAGGRLPVRVTVALLDSARAALGGRRPGDGDDLVGATSWKLIADGSNQGRSGYLRTPYLGSDERGAPNYSTEALQASMARAQGEGWQLMVHANGDAALDQVLDAYEGIDADPALRHRIEHSSLATDEHFARMAATGVSPSFLVNHVYYWGRALRDDVLGPDRAATLDAAASALRHRLRISFHSDYDVSPIAPLRSVQTAVTRGMRGGGTLNPAEAVSVEAALRAVTIDAAWQTHSDDQIGSLEVGKQADLVILGADPQQVDPMTIADIAVRETRLRGRRIHPS